jgi:hypothetical protein
LKNYRSELARYGAQSLEVSELVKLVGDICTDSQRTYFESQLCRCLRKQPPANKEKALQYKSVFAHVPSSSIQPLLWETIEKLLAEPVEKVPAVTAALPAPAPKVEKAAPKEKRAKR